MGHPVIKIVFLLLTFFSNAQEPKKAHNVLLIEQVVSWDTIVNDVRKEMIEIRMKTGKMTKLDRIVYVEKIRNRKINVFGLARNKGLKEKIVRKDAILFKYFNKEELKYILENIPPNEKHNLDALANEINIIQVKQNLFQKIPTHYFSSSFKSGNNNRYIVYHKKVNNVMDGYSEFIIYDYIDGNIIIKAWIPLSIS